MLRVILATWILVSAALAEQTVEGHVVNSVTGAGIPGVSVSLTQHLLGNTATGAYSATTDFEGRFRIEAVKDGAYTANYVAGGFWAPSNVFQGGGPRPPFRVITGTSPVHLEAKLWPIGKVSGRVLDNAGKPVPNASLWLRQNWDCNPPSCVADSHQAKTDANGEYSITDLEGPGAWIVAATAPPSMAPPESRDDQRLGWAQTFYPNASESQFAPKVIVHPGDDLWVEIKLAPVPVYNVRGRVLDVRGDPARGVTVTLDKSRTSPSFKQNTKDDGTFEFTSVADGEWRLSAMAAKDDVRLWAGKVTPVKGDDLENIELRLSPPFSIQVRIIAEVPEGALPPKPPPFMLAYAGSLAETHSGAGPFRSKTDETGGFSFQNLYPGPYRILTIGIPSYYLDSIRLGDRDAMESEVEIQSDSQPLTITYKQNGGTVRGSVEACGASIALLIPQDPLLRHQHFLRSAACAPNGRFEFPAVRPGEYFLSLSDHPRFAGASPAQRFAGMSEEGIRITVRANESTAADLRLIKQ